MASRNITVPAMSESIEMYLIRVAQLRQDGQPVPLSQLAQELAITSVSANEMCRKLTEKGLVEYEPYKGVTLTPDGDLLARRVLRCRHLWEIFLVEKLGLAPAEADDIACRFEHVTSDDLADRLAAFLANAAPGDQQSTQEDCLLTTLTAGQHGLIIDLSADPVIKDFLKQQGIALGETVTVLSVAADGSLLLEVAGLPLSLSQRVAQTINVTRTSTQSPTEKESRMTTETTTVETKPPAMKQISLDQLPLGTQGVVVRIGGEKAIRRRLIDMGMIPGETVKLKKVAPLGDPLELEVKNYKLSLRKNEASQIIVEVA